MVESLPIVVLDEYRGPDTLAIGDRTVSSNLDVLGGPGHLQVGVKYKQVRVADIVPVARVLSSKIVQTTLKMLKAIAAPVPCQKRCAAQVLIRLRPLLALYCSFTGVSV